MCVHIPGEDWVWYVCDMMHAVLYVYVNCFVVRGCAVPRRYINVCNSDVFSVAHMYLDHLKFCVMCIKGQRYVCYSECNVAAALSNLPVRTVVKLCTFGVFALGMSLVL